MNQTFERLKAWIYVGFCFYLGIFHLLILVLTIFLDIHFNEPITFVNGVHANGISYALQNSDISNLLLILNMYFAFSILHYLIVLYPFIEFLFSIFCCRNKKI